MIGYSYEIEKRRFELMKLDLRNYPAGQNMIIIEMIYNVMSKEETLK